MNRYEMLKGLTFDQMANFMNDLMTSLCKQYCAGCRKVKYDCREAMEKWLDEEVKA